METVIAVIVLIWAVIFIGLFLLVFYFTCWTIANEIVIPALEKRKQAKTEAEYKKFKELFDCVIFQDGIKDDVLTMKAQQHNQWDHLERNTERIAKLEQAMKKRRK